MERHSTRRDVVFDVIKNTTSHPTASWVYESARKQIPNISLGTVYRNIALLLEKGDIISIDAGDGIVRYDACVKDHIHFYCTKCKSVLDVSLDVPATFCNAAEEQLGCEVDRQHIVLFGCCNNCNKK